MTSLPTRRQTVPSRRGRTNGIRVIADSTEEAAVVALRLALIEREPAARCFFYARDLTLSLAVEGQCEGTVLCRRVTDGADRVSPARRLAFNLSWTRAKDEYSLPTIKLTKSDITEV